MRGKVSVSKEDSEKRMLSYISDKYPNATPVLAPASGKLLWEADFAEGSTPPAPGREYKAGDVMGVVQAFFGNADISAPTGGKLVDTCVPQGTQVKKGEIVAWII